MYIIVTATDAATAHRLSYSVHCWKLPLAECMDIMFFTNNNFSKRELFGNCIIMMQYTHKSTHTKLIFAYTLSITTAYIISKDYNQLCPLKRTTHGWLPIWHRLCKARVAFKSQHLNIFCLRHHHIINQSTNNSVTMLETEKRPLHICRSLKASIKENYT